MSIIFFPFQDAPERVALSSLSLANPKLVPDLCGMHSIHEAGILANLEVHVPFVHSSLAWSINPRD
jgi:hypothetical protein